MSAQALKLFVHSDTKAETFGNTFLEADSSMHIKMLSKL